MIVWGGRGGDGSNKTSKFMVTLNALEPHRQRLNVAPRRAAAAAAAASPLQASSPGRLVISTKSDAQPARLESGRTAPSTTTRFVSVRGRRAHLCAEVRLRACPVLFSVVVFAPSCRPLPKSPAHFGSALATNETPTKTTPLRLPFRSLLDLRPIGQPPLKLFIYISLLCGKSSKHEHWCEDFKLISAPSIKQLDTYAPTT
jgi:hypothetical protein